MQDKFFKILGCAGLTLSLESAAQALDINNDDNISFSSPAYFAIDVDLEDILNANACCGNGGCTCNGSCR